MDIEKYLSVLPEHVLTNGEFCVTQMNDKRPFDPFKKFSISAKDKFYHISELLDGDIEDYDTIGIKVMNTISAIDIDHCVHKGKLSDVAEDIVQSLKSYTEISPSGTGIRILFKAKNEFDRKRYKIKNSGRGIEYYDGVDQITKGGRMVRLSADEIYDFDFIEVDTTNVLDRYMAKDFVETYEFDETEINMKKCYFIGQYLRKDYSIYDVYYRHMSMLSESEWDLILANHISFYTQNINEIRYIFEKTGYHKKKDKKHITKWNDTQYATNMFKIVRPSLANEKVLSYAMMYDEYEPEDDFVIDPSLLVHLAIEMKFIKPVYMSKYALPVILSQDDQTVVNHLSLVAHNRRHILKYLQSFFTEKEG